MEHGTLWGHGAYLGPDYSGGVPPPSRRDRARHARDAQRYGKPVCAALDARTCALEIARAVRAHAEGESLRPGDRDAPLLAGRGRGLHDPAARVERVLLAATDAAPGLPPRYIENRAELDALTAYFAWATLGHGRQPSRQGLLVHEQLAVRAAGGQRPDRVDVSLERAQPRHAARRARARPLRLRQVRLSRLERRARPADTGTTTGSSAGSSRRASGPRGSSSRSWRCSSCSRPSPAGRSRTTAWSRAHSTASISRGGCRTTCSGPGISSSPSSGSPPHGSRAGSSSRRSSAARSRQDSARGVLVLLGALARRRRRQPRRRVARHQRSTRAASGSGSVTRARSTSISAASGSSCSRRASLFWLVLMFRALRPAMRRARRAASSPRSSSTPPSRSPSSTCPPCSTARTPTSPSSTTGASGSSTCGSRASSSSSPRCSWPSCSSRWASSPPGRRRASSISTPSSTSARGIVGTGPPLVLHRPGHAQHGARRRASRRWRSCRSRCSRSTPGTSSACRIARCAECGHAFAARQTVGDLLPHGGRLLELRRRRRLRLPHQPADRLLLRGGHAAHEQSRPHGDVRRVRHARPRRRRLLPAGARRRRPLAARRRARSDGLLGAERRPRPHGRCSISFRAACSSSGTSSRTATGTHGGSRS